jgi:hypothetical protein
MMYHIVERRMTDSADSRNAVVEDSVSNAPMLIRSR